MTEQALCAGCLEPMAAPGMIDQVNLEAQYREDYGKDATREDVQRVLLCEKCLSRLNTIRDGSKKK